MSRPAETIGTAVHATAIAIYRMIESDVRAVVAADDRTRLSFFEDFDLGLRRLADPFDGMSEPGIGWICDVAHGCNRVLSMKQRIAEAWVRSPESDGNVPRSSIPDIYLCRPFRAGIFF